MITSAFLLIISLLLYGFAFYLPSAEALPPDIETSFSWLVDESFKFNYIFPMDTIWLQIGIAIPLLVAYFLWSLFAYAIALFRGN